MTFDTHQQIRPMRFHGPGWELNLSTYEDDGYTVIEPGGLFQVWAPQSADKIWRDEENYPGQWTTNGIMWNFDATKPRDHWAAGATWPEGQYPGKGYIQGSSLEEVLTIFPADIAQRFRTVIA